jgi:site-specific recombinase XerD
MGNLVWHFEPLHIQDWAARLTAFDGTPLAAASRARAVSAVRSYYAHCKDDLGAARWNLAPRAHPAGRTRDP